MENRKCLTPGHIADCLGVPIHRVQHILATRPHIRPRARAGTLRVYTNEDLDLIAAELDAIDGRRQTLATAGRDGAA